MRKAFFLIIISSLIILPFGNALAVGTNYRYTGQELDPIGLYYYGQRYYDPLTGRFTQPDPLANYLTDPQKLKQTTGQDLQQFLANPQNLNPYSYVQNNPVRYVDPKGEWLTEFFTGRQSPSSFNAELGEAAMYVGPVMKTAIDHPYFTGFLSGLLAGGGLAAGSYLLGQGGLILASRTLPQILISQTQRIFKGDQDLRYKEVVSTAQQKLEEVSRVIGKSVDFILKEGSKSRSIFTDLRADNYGNVNVFFKDPVNSEKLIRITLDPTLNRIISSNFNRINQVEGWIKSGELINFIK